MKLKFTRKAEKDLDGIPVQLRIKILRKAKERLESDPSPDGNQIKKIIEDPLGILHRFVSDGIRLLFTCDVAPAALSSGTAGRRPNVKRQTLTPRIRAYCVVKAARWAETISSAMAYGTAS